mmetsp:Transcript_59166/g.114164  ORF Transcript_59166/g.114164 Transcript_59166/m.114164 type:complete len:287 (+) Transcript_59166:74-934(+)
MMRHLSSGRGHRRDQKPSHAAKFVAILGTMMALGLFWGTDAAAFLGPARKGWSEQLVVTPGSSVVAASVRSVTASSLLRPRATGLPGAGASATNVFWAIVLFVGTCSVRGTATSRRASQHKLRSCSVTCQAVGLPMPVMFQPRTPAVEELTHTPAVAPPPKVAHATKPRTIAFRAVMVGGVRCIATARSAARRARQRQTADQAATSRAARRAVGSCLQASLCLQEVPPLNFDASRQRLKIQAGLCLAKRVLSGHMAEARLFAGKAKRTNASISAVLYVIRLHNSTK